MASRTNKIQLFNLSNVAELYSSSRPEVPDDVVDKVIKYMQQELSSPPFGQMVEVGCGSGQGTRKFSKFFSNVLATDISSVQIEHALRRISAPHVTFKVSPAESMPIGDECAQLVTAGVCFHYFDHLKFLREASRVLVKNAVLAVYTYTNQFLFKDKELNNKTEAFQNDLTTTLGYKLEFSFAKFLKDNSPFGDCQQEMITVFTSMKLKNFTKYLRSLGVVENYLRIRGEASMNTLLQNILKCVEDHIGTNDPEYVLEMKWNYMVTLARKI